MRCPTLADLPPPPPGKTGWPWTVESPQLPEVMPDGGPWPRISIVTPSYNQGQFIEETIRSLLLQGYPDIEYIVVDGGSSDGTVDIIARYEPWLAYWHSAQDNGQTDAINIGFEKATGEWLAYINSDDTYLLGALKAAVSMAASAWVVGGCIGTDATGRHLRHFPPLSPTSRESWLRMWERGQTLQIAQPAVFWRSDVMKRLGPFSTQLEYVFDHEYFMRITEIFGKPSLCDLDLATYRMHPASLTCTRHRLFRKERIETILEWIMQGKIDRRISSIIKTRWALTQIYAEELVEGYENQRVILLRDLFEQIRVRPLLALNRLFVAYLLRRTSQNELRL